MAQQSHVARRRLSWILRHLTALVIIPSSLKDASRWTRLASMIRVLDVTARWLVACLAEKPIHRWLAGTIFARQMPRDVEIGEMPRGQYLTTSWRDLSGQSMHSDAILALGLSTVPCATSVHQTAGEFPSRDSRSIRLDHSEDDVKHRTVPSRDVGHRPTRSGRSPSTTQPLSSSRSRPASCK